MHAMPFRIVLIVSMFILFQPSTLPAAAELSEPSTSLEKETSAGAVSKPPPSPGARETGRDGRFVAYDNGTVKDTTTNLMWAAKDNGTYINWRDAKSYCANYRGGGYTDWRMPTPDELAGLYDPAKSYRTDCEYAVQLTELIRLSCTFAWTSETNDSDAAIFAFHRGRRAWTHQSTSKPTRALPVRSAK